MFIKVGFTNTPLTPKKSNVIYNDILEYLISIEFKFKDIRIDIENLTKYSFDDEDCKAQIRGIKTTQLLNSI